MEQLTDIDYLDDKQDEKNWLAMAFLATFFLFLLSRLFIIPLLSYLNETKASEEYVTFTISFPHQLLVFFGLLILAAMMFPKLSFRKKLGLTNFNILYCFEGVMVKLYIIPMSYIIGLLSYLFFETFFGEVPKPEILKKLMECSDTSFMIIFVAAVFMAPIVEELVFRRVMFGFFQNYIGTAGSFVLTSIIFAAIHLNPLQFAGLFFLAVMLQLLYVCHKSIYPCIFLHMANNLFSMVALFVMRMNPEQYEILKRFLEE